MNKTYFLKKWLSKLGALPVSAAQRTPEGKYYHWQYSPWEHILSYQGGRYFCLLQKAAQGRAGAAAHTWALRPSPASLSEFLGALMPQDAQPEAKNPLIQCSYPENMSSRAVPTALGQQTMPFSLSPFSKARPCLKWTMCWSVFLADSSLSFGNNRAPSAILQHRDE